MSPHHRRRSPIEDQPLYDAARTAGCSDAEARFLVAYRHSEGYRDAAKKLNRSERTLKNHSTNIRKRWGEPHLGAVYARIGCL